jgi:hypothetical protein
MVNAVDEKNTFNAFSDDLETTTGVDSENARCFS